MRKFDKLLTEVGPADPPARVAQRALKTRLRAVVHYLDRAAETGGEEPETIHQLRIWTRRSQAAINLFFPLLPPRKARRLKRTLRRLRRTAGAVRDLDVVEEQLGSALHGPLAERLKGERAAAQKDLRRLLRRWSKRGKLKRKVKRLLKRTDQRSGHENNGTAFAAWCRGQIAPLADDFRACGQRGGSQSDQGLHQWRLAAKRLRYALELAVAALPQATWTQLYELLSDLQERIGGICDRLLEQERLRQLRRATDDRDDRAVLEKLAAGSQQQLARLKSRFTRWWSSSRKKSAESLLDELVSSPRTSRTRSSLRPYPPSRRSRPGRREKR